MLDHLQAADRVEGGAQAVADARFDVQPDERYVFWPPLAAIEVERRDRVPAVREAPRERAGPGADVEHAAAGRHIAAKQCDRLGVHTSIGVNQHPTVVFRLLRSRGDQPVAHRLERPLRSITNGMA